MANLAESPTDLTGRSWRYLLRRAVSEFSKDECTDLAAALTYYAILALFPGLIALLALVGLGGQQQSRDTVEAIMDVLSDLGAGSLIEDLDPTLVSLANASGTAGIAFASGLALALWSASGYVGSFGRAMNRVYEIKEGRPIWKLRPWLLLVTFLTVMLAALVCLALVLTGPVALAVGDAAGIGSSSVTIWNIAKWPFLLLAVITLVSVLYYATPNVRQPPFRWISPGAVLAVLAWLLASAGFGFYVSNFGSYNKSYGALAGVVVFLLWLWLTNLALLLGAELNVEVERARELQAGLPAERKIQLEPRDVRNIERSSDKLDEVVSEGRELRRAHSKSDTRRARSKPDHTPQESTHDR
jgi:membrane protein